MTPASGPKQWKICTLPKSKSMKIQDMNIHIYIHEIERSLESIPKPLMPKISDCTN